MVAGGDGGCSAGECVYGGDIFTKGSGASGEGCELWLRHYHGKERAVAVGVVGNGAGGAGFTALTEIAILGVVSIAVVDVTVVRMPAPLLYLFNLFNHVPLTSPSRFIPLLSLKLPTAYME